MSKKNTHAIVLEYSTTRVPVPSDIPGRNTFFTELKVDKVNCSYLPGFLTHWRTSLR